MRAFPLLPLLVTASALIGDDQSIIYTGPGGHCVTSAECVGGSFCRDGICVCPGGASAMGGICHYNNHDAQFQALMYEKSRELPDRIELLSGQSYATPNRPCDHGEICIGGSRCLRGHCRCAEGYYSLNFKCVASDPSAREREFPAILPPINDAAAHEPKRLQAVYPNRVPQGINYAPTRSERMQMFQYGAVDPVRSQNLIYTVPYPGQACTSTCAGGATCISGTCACPPTFMIQNTICVQVAVNQPVQVAQPAYAWPGQTCGNSVSCAMGSVCQTGSCGCPTGSINIVVQCVTPDGSVTTTKAPDDGDGGEATTSQIEETTAPIDTGGEVTVDPMTTASIGEVTSEVTIDLPATVSAAEATTTPPDDGAGGSDTTPAVEVDIETTITETERLMSLLHEPRRDKISFDRPKPRSPTQSSPKSDLIEVLNPCTTSADCDPAARCKDSTCVCDKSAYMQIGRYCLSKMA